jgi:hypothetical protein
VSVDSPPSDVPARRVPPLVAWAALAVLVAGNFYLRHTLEDAPHRMYSFLEYFYKPQIPIIFGRSWWRLLLPIPELTGSWCATSLILTYLVERALTPAGAWELFNAVSIVAAFGAGWVAFRSSVFALTLAICIGFGTQFYHAYAVTGGIASYLLVTYHLVLLAAIVQIVRGARPAWAWWVTFAVGLAFNVLAYEGWLDLLAAMWVAVPFAVVLLWHQQRGAEGRRLLRVLAIMTAVGIAYVLVKTNVGYGQVRGSESDVVLNYHALRPAIEDVIGNVFTHTFMSVSNFLPPAMVGATTFYWFGADYVIAGQQHYVPAFSYLAVLNQVFFWRYYAGVVLTLVVLALGAAAAAAWRRRSAWAIAPGIFLIMILVAAPTHTLIKYRPMNSEPVMTYHVTVGILGMSLLLAWLLTAVWRRVRPRPLAAVIVAAGWIFLLSGALTRPPYLAHMAAQAGLGESIYPNPLQALLARLHRPYAAPMGESLYRLTPYDPYAESARTRALLDVLPDTLPPAGDWQVVSPTGRIVARVNGTVEMIGDATQAGYQMMSPPFAIRPGTHYIVRVRFESRAGQVCAGVLSADQQRWLVPPSVFAPEASFDSGTDTSVRAVLANCNPQADGNPSSDLRLQGGSFAALAARP